LKKLDCKLEQKDFRNFDPSFKHQKFAKERDKTLQLLLILNSKKEKDRT